MNVVLADDKTSEGTADDFAVGARQVEGCISWSGAWFVLARRQLKQGLG